VTVRGNIVPHKSGSDHVAEDGKANLMTETPLSRTSSKPAKSQQRRAHGRESRCTTRLTDSMAACNMESTVRVRVATWRCRRRPRLSPMRRALGRHDAEGRLLQPGNVHMTMRRGPSAGSVGSPAAKCEGTRGQVMSLRDQDSQRTTCHCTGGYGDTAHSRTFARAPDKHLKIAM
jgi:hypothetical protein